MEELSSYEAIQLRPEAQAALIDALDARQRRGFLRVQTLLEAATRDVKLSPNRVLESVQSPPYLEPDRSSRTALIHGARGTGKTTLLLSLIRALTPPHYRHEPGDKRAAALRAKLVWLEVLDLEPLAASTNLLGAILARLEAAAGRYLHPAEPKATLMDPNVPQPDAMRELMKLQARAATAVDGNLPARAGGLDPDNFAAESARAERHRLDLNQRFAEVVALLAQQIARSSREFDQPPVFVLAVDDLDLNPTSCVPLLELLRAVHSPHLFVILLADIQITQKILRLHYQRRFIEVAGTHQLDDGYAEDARDLAANALRKHFPPEQRVRLAKADLREALGFKPLDPDSSKDELWTLFAEGALIDDWVWLPAIPWAGDRFPAQPIKLQQLRVEPQTERYSWQRIFQLTSRELVDAYLDAVGGKDDAESENERKPLARLVRSRLAELTEVEENDSPPTGEITSVPVLTAVLDWSRQNLRGGGQVEAATIRRWSTRGTNPHLTADEQHTLAGALDIDPGPNLEADVNTILPIDGSHTARECESLRRTLWPEAAPVPWPMPQHSTCWGYERGATKLRDNDAAWHRSTQQPDPLFGSWVETMTTIVQEALGVDSTPEPPHTWDTVHQRLGRLGQLGDKPLAHRWCAEVFALCTPEMGMLEPSVVWRDVDPALEELVQHIRTNRADNQSEDFRQRMRRWRPPPTHSEPGGPTSGKTEPKKATS